MKNLIVLLVLVMTAATSRAQQNPQPVKAVDSLHYMLGTWKGEGWIRKGSEKQFFQQTEVITSKVDGLSMLVEGLGYSIDSVSSERKKVHDAFGVVYYDSEGKTFKIMTFSTASPKVDAPFLKMKPRVLQWSFVTDNGGSVRFTEDFSKKDAWKGTGEYSMGGNQWFTFMEYTLKLTQSP